MTHNTLAVSGRQTAGSLPNFIIKTDLSRGAVMMPLEKLTTSSGDYDFDGKERDLDGGTGAEIENLLKKRRSVGGQGC